MANLPEEKMPRQLRKIFLIIVAVVLFFMSLEGLFGWFVTVPSGHVGIHTRFKKYSELPLYPGFHTKLPWFDNVII